MSFNPFSFIAGAAGAAGGGGGGLPGFSDSGSATSGASFGGVAVGGLNAPPYPFDSAANPNVYGPPAQATKPDSLTDKVVVGVVVALATALIMTALRKR